MQPHSNDYVAVLPVVLDWIHRSLDAHVAEKRRVDSFKFVRLPQYFSAEILKSASFVIPDDPPRPPLSASGLLEFAAFEHQRISGITYLDTYFVTPPPHTMNQCISFSGKVLGPEQVLLLYAAGLAEFGYLDSLLERMAYEHQRRFDAGEPPYPVEVEEREKALALRSAFREPLLSPLE